MILMKCPDFPGDDSAAFAKLFGNPNFNYIFKILKEVVAGNEVKPHYGKNAYRPTELSEEVINHGFSPFDLLSQHDQNQEQKCDLSETKIEPTQSPPSKKRRVFGNVTVSDCVEWLSENRNNSIVVSKILQPFTPREFHKKMINMMPKFKALNCFAILGLSTNAHNSQEKLKNTLQGTVLMQWHESPTYNLQRDIKRLQTLLENNFGLSQEDIFRTNDFLTNPENVSKIKNQVRYKFKEYTEEEKRQVNDSYERMSKRGDYNVKPIDTSRLLRDSECLQINLSEDFDLSNVNSIAALMGSSPNNLEIRELLVEETMEKCKSQEIYSVSKTQIDYYTNRKLAKRLFDFYLFFTNEMKLSDLYPIVNDAVDACKEALDNFELLPEFNRCATKFENVSLLWYSSKRYC